MKRIDDRYFIRKDGKNIPEQTIESILEPEEKILWRGKPLRKSFLLSAFFRFFFIALIWAAIDAAIISLLVINVPELPLPVIIFLCFFFLLHLLPVWMWIYSIISAGKRQKEEEYAFTEKRIIVKKGFIGAEVQSYPYSSMTSVNLRIGIIEKLCHVGDIYLVFDNQRAVLEDIEDPYFIYGQLQKIANDIKSDILYPNALRPNENPGYKTSYRGDISVSDRHHH